MPRKSSGGISLYSDGRWAVRIQVDGKRVVRYAKTIQEAEKVRRALLKGVKQESTPTKIPELKSENVHPQLPKSTKGKLPQDVFSSFVEKWIAMAGLKPITEASYTQLLKGYINPVVGNKALIDITPTDVALVIGKAREKNLSDRTVQYIYTVMRRVLQIATDWELIERNPAAKIKRPRSESKEKTVWSVEETQQFKNSLNQGKGTWDTFFLVALLSGLRLGELLGLDWNDIDFVNSTLKVQRSLIELDGLKYHLQTPKTRSSIRTITLPPQAIDALRKYQQEHTSKGFIFRRVKGEPPSRSTLRSAFVTACKRAGVPYISIHGLRHQHISLLAHAGVSVKAASQRAGHSTPQITLNIYTHVLGDTDKQTTLALTNLLA